MRREDEPVFKDKRAAEKARERDESRKEDEPGLKKREAAVNAK